MSRDEAASGNLNETSLIKKFHNKWNGVIFTASIITNDKKPFGVSNILAENSYPE